MKSPSCHDYRGTILYTHRGTILSVTVPRHAVKSDIQQPVLRVSE